MGDEEKILKACNYAYLLFKYRPRSIREIEHKLHQKGYDEKTIETVVNLLKEQGYLDDAAFAKLWVLERTSAKPKGVKLIRYELKSKGIDGAIIDDVLKNVGNSYDEYETAKKLAQRRIKQYNRSDLSRLERRLYQYLRRRGFSYEVIRQVIEEIV